MPLAPPPFAKPIPRIVPLRRGELLWRVHSRHRSPADFKDVRSDAVFGGGRFDSTEDAPFPYLYLASDPETALLESRLRGIAFDQRGIRNIYHKLIKEMRLSPVRVTRDLSMVALVTTPDLAAVYQDEWLIHSPAAEFPATRRWGHWLRRHADTSQGFVWLSARDLGRTSVILFGDRCPEKPLAAEGDGAIDLDGPGGVAWINERLKPYRFRVKRPGRLSL